MHKLLNLFIDFKQILRSQISIYNELVLVLDEEESLISEFEMNQLEPVLIKKDQIVQRASQCDIRRQEKLKQICFSMAYDARNGLPTLEELNILIEKYLSNIEKLVDQEIFHQLVKHHQDLKTISLNFKELFADVAPRIYRNKQVLAKIIDNIQKSISLFQSEGGFIDSYNAIGKPSQSNKTAKKSAFQVKV